MKSNIEVHSIFGKEITHQVLNRSAWITICDGRFMWAYTNDKRACLGIIKNNVTNSVNVESVSEYDMISLLDHFHCSVDNTNSFRENVI
jgi:hypothetical protein